MSALQQLVHAAEGILATTSGPEPIAVLGELSLKDWLDDHPRRGLHDAVRDRRYAQRSLLAAAQFWDHDPFDRPGLVGASLEVLLHGEQPFLAVFSEVSYRDAVHAAGPCIRLHRFPGQLKGSVGKDFVDETEPHLSFDSRFESQEHLLAPDAALGLVTLPQGFFSLLIRRRNLRRLVFAWSFA